MMNRIILLFILTTAVLTSCDDYENRPDGDDASKINNTNETVVIVNIPFESWPIPTKPQFDRLNDNVVIEFFDNEGLSGSPIEAVQLNMVESTGDGEIAFSERESELFRDLLEEGNYWARAYLDLNNNGQYDGDLEPLETWNQEIRTLKESKRTVTFTFD